MQINCVFGFYYAQHVVQWGGQDGAHRVGKKARARRLRELELAARMYQPDEVLSDRCQALLWNGGKGMDGWLGAPDDTIEQRVMKVAHVGFTPVGERCRFAASLSCADGWNGW